jgi:hypothetical protein
MLAQRMKSANGFFLMEILHRLEPFIRWRKVIDRETRQPHERRSGMGAPRRIFGFEQQLR